MTNHSFGFVYLFLLIALTSSGHRADAKEDVAYGHLVQRVRGIGKLIDAGEYAAVSRLVDDMEESFGENPCDYIAMAWEFLIASERRVNDQVLPLWERVYRKSLEMDVTASTIGLKNQIDILDCRLRVAKRYGEKLSIMDDRKSMAQRVIDNMQKIQTFIDDSWDESQKYKVLGLIEIPEDEPELFAGMYNGPFAIFNLPSENIKDLGKREKFERQIKEAKATMEKADIQIAAKRDRKQILPVAKKFLVELYSLQPFATAELEALLKEPKVDEAFAKEILDAVKEAEKNADTPKTEAKPE